MKSTNEDLMSQKDIRKSILKMMLLFAAAASFLSAVVNTLNNRPLVNTIYPLVVLIVMVVLFVVLKVFHYYKPIKYFVLIFINIIYVPAAWLTSPGSMSAMPFYAILITIFGIVLIDDLWEVVFSVITIIEVIILMQMEWISPSLFMVYDDMKFRIIDISINYMVVITIIFAILLLINRNYKKSYDVVYKLSITDPLTGIYNRRYMMNTLEAIHNASVRLNDEYCLLMIDINNFKSINDKYGHLEGDQVLSYLGGLLKQESRNYDICCRYGGDEFVVILPRAEIEQAKVYSDRISSEFNLFSQKYSPVDVGLSIGITQRQNYTVSEMIELADNRLYEKKHNKADDGGYE